MPDLSDLSSRLHSGYAELAPVGPLGEVVDRLYAYSEQHRGPVWHRGLPSSALTLIVGVGPAVDVQMPGGTDHNRHAVFVGGIHTAAARVQHVGRQEGVQLALRPEAVLPLLGVPAGALAGQVVDLADILPPVSHRALVDRAGSASDLRSRAEAVGAELLEIMARRARRVPVGRPAAGAIDPPLRRVLAVMRATGGQVGIAEVADEVGFSRRHLSRRMNGALGVPPKALARLFRMDATLRALGPGTGGPGRTADHATLARLASRLGFADHAHLAREVRAMTGASPTRIIAERAAGGSMRLSADMSHSS